MGCADAVDVAPLHQEEVSLHVFGRNHRAGLGV